MKNTINFTNLITQFENNTFNNEDDIKINFYSSLICPLLEVINPIQRYNYKSEDRLLAGGRSDATFQNLIFEFKKYNYFKKQKGIEEALYGRDKKDHGLYDYLLSNAGIDASDSIESILFKIQSGIGIAFDGKNFLFARFIYSPIEKEINSSKILISLPDKLPLEFIYEKKNIELGLKKIAILLKQQEQMALTKQNLLKIINTKNKFVRNTIKQIYNELHLNIKTLEGSSRVQILYKEWDRVFGIMYGNDKDATDFTEVTSTIKEAYGFEPDIDIDSKIYLFALQTFFNIFLKLLIYSFLSQLVDPSFTYKEYLDKANIDRLFDGNLTTRSNIVNNFFESHFLEWFTYTDSKFEVKIINDILEQINLFDLNTFVLKPEKVQDILQEVYMELIPSKMRHLMGEYFSPDWIVEHSLDLLGYTGDIDKKIIDPCAGSGSFLTQAIKKIIQKQNGFISKSDVYKITTNVVGFDINPISVVAAKANYILILFSAYFKNNNDTFDYPVSIPIFIADSILSPVVYAEENDDTLKIQTCVDKLELPKFESYEKGSVFLSKLSQEIHEKSCDFNLFKELLLSKKIIAEKDVEVVKNLYDTLYIWHRSGKDSFWPIILKNSFAPIIINNKFDYVVGNPPWIAWKSMSKSYREGTLSIWKSYGIFEKNAYDKKTTHDDFGMAVTYVAIDQYLKLNGEMVFLLPASFLKSTKGGQGFRKFEIIRKNQDIPFAIQEVHDFSKVKLFTIPTVAIKFKKGIKMKYPMNKYIAYSQVGTKSKIDSHATWNMITPFLEKKQLTAQPVDMNDIQSSWLTMEVLNFTNKVLDNTKKRFYRGRKGIEPAGAKGVFLLKKPIRLSNGYLKIENDISRQRRQDIKEKGSHVGIIEEKYIYPMLGGRNISKWGIKSNEFILLPHSIQHKYGIPEQELIQNAPNTYEWLSFYKEELLATRIQNGKFFNPDIHPFYRLDNVGEYSFTKYKVLWKEQTGSMSAVVVSTYNQTITNADIDIFSTDKIIVVDSKVLMYGTDNKSEAYYLCGILNSQCIVEIIDSYAIATNRGVDVLKYLAIPQFDNNDTLHTTISNISFNIHELFRKNKKYHNEEILLNKMVQKLFL